MSIRIGHGYRVQVSDFNDFLPVAQARLAKVRDDLDAALFAQAAAEAHDRALRDQRDYYGHATLREAAHTLFMGQVTGGPPGTVFHHPHSLDLDYAQPTETGPWYVLLHARNAYHDAFRTLPGVETYEYWNHTDTLPDGVTEKQWVQRKSDWQWLLDAPTIGSVMHRWTHREDPEPDLSYVTHPDVFTTHVPTPEDRARDIARDLTVAEFLRDIENPQWEHVHDALLDDGRRSRSAALIPHIAAQLPMVDVAALDSSQPDLVVLDIPNVAT